MSVQVRCCRKEARLCSGLNKVCAGWMRIILKRLPKPAFQRRFFNLLCVRCGGTGGDVEIVT